MLFIKSTSSSLHQLSIQNQRYNLILLELVSSVIKTYLKIHKTDFKIDTVYLYQFRRLKNCPNMSPFCMKIEIICRIYGIPYEVVTFHSFYHFLIVSRLSKMLNFAQEVALFHSSNSTKSTYLIQI